MPKKGENIHKRKDGRWEWRYIDFYKIDGKPHYKSVYSHSYTEVKNLKNTSKPVSKTKIIFPVIKDIKQISNEWLECIAVKIKQSTRANYHTIVENHIMPYFSKIPLSHITTEIFEKFIVEKSNQEVPKKLSAKTVRCIVSVLAQILKFAEKHNYITPINYDVALPKIKRKKPNILPNEQQDVLKEYLLNNLSNEAIGILIVLHTGIRLGEICSLTWDDVDFQSGELLIRKTIQRVKNLNNETSRKTRLIIDTPKSEKSIRNIPLPDFLLKILKTYSKFHNKAEYILTGNRKYCDPRTFQNKFKAFLSKAKINKINFHAIRHTFGTKAIEVGFDAKSLSEILGHSSVRFSLDNYVQSTQEQQKSCIEKLAQGY